MDKTRILVVEDETVVAMYIQVRLVVMGYEVAGLAATYREAIELASHCRPDLVLMDVELQGAMDGIRAADRIRADYDLPVVYLTGHSDETTVNRIKQTEPYGFLLKPFEECELQSVIEIALYKHAAERRLRDSERWLAAVLRSSGDGVLATDAEGRVKFLNPAAEAVTGWTQAEALGRPAVEVFALVDADSGCPLDHPVDEVISGAERVFLPPRSALLSRDGRIVPIGDSAAPIRDERGRFIGCVITFEDVSERLALQAETAGHRQLESRVENMCRAVAELDGVLTDLQCELGERAWHRSMSLAAQARALCARRAHGPD